MYLTDGVMNIQRNSLNSVSIRSVACDRCGEGHSPTSLDFITIRGDILQGLSTYIFPQTLHRNRVTSDAHYCKNCLLRYFPCDLISKLSAVLSSTHDMITLLDDRGRETQENSRMLRQSEWDELRTTLYNSSEILLSILYSHGSDEEDK